MITIEEIEAKLKKELKPTLLKITNDSQKHAGHSGAIPGQITHLHIEVASDKFNDLSTIKQHRLINAILAEDLQNGLHALSLKTHKATNL